MKIGGAYRFWDLIKFDEVLESITDFVGLLVFTPIKLLKGSHRFHNSPVSISRYRYFRLSHLLTWRALNPDWVYWLAQCLPARQQDRLMLAAATSS